MAKQGKAGISWTDETWNPIRGCSRVSDGCKNCYAERQAMRIVRMDRGRGVPEGAGTYDGLVTDSSQGPKWAGRVRFVPELLLQPLRWRRPRMIFVNSMSDLFHDDVLDDVIDRVFAVMALCPQHTFQVLTKRPQRMRDYLTTGGFGRWGYVDGRARQILRELNGRQIPAGKMLMGPLPHVWLGVSAENQASADERIPILLDTPSAVRWLSAEPLLGDLRLGQWLQLSPSTMAELNRLPPTAPAWTRIGSTRLDWVVVGGESGPNARPMHPAWPRSLRDECARAGVPFHFKQHGEWLATVFASDEQATTPYSEIGYLHPNGELQDGSEGIDFFGGVEEVTRVGKRAAGRQLDGHIWDEMPDARAL